jgi:hypothetical protein
MVVCVAKCISLIKKEELYFFLSIMETSNFTAKDVPQNFSHQSNSHKSNSNIGFWIVFISILFFAFLVFSKWDKISNFLGSTSDAPSVESGFVVWEQISVEGILTQDGDFITHTHKLTTLSSGIFGLKSKTINLNQYSWTIVVEWIIDSQYQDLYILEVSNIIAQIAENLSWDSMTWETLYQWSYLPELWLFLSPDFFQEYSIVSTGKTAIELKSLSSSVPIKIEYFVCKKWDPNKDCKQLSTTFAESSEKNFTNQYGVVFYKLSEVNSWFFANQELFGYFVNWVSEQELTNVASHIQLSNAWYVDTVLKPSISSFCRQGNVIMTQIKKSSFSLDMGKPAVSFDGSWEKGSVSCTLVLDMSSSLFGTLKSFTYKEESLTGTLQTGLQQPIVSIPSQADPTVKQFAITPEKPLTFTSGRGHSIVFPSSRISYSTSNVSEDLGQLWVNCYAATKVIEYTKKDLIDSEPSVIVYECKLKANVTLPTEYYSYPLSDWRIFVASVRDPAWHDFASNIQVSLNQ